MYCRSKVKVLTFKFDLLLKIHNILRIHLLIFTAILLFPFLQETPSTEQVAETQEATPMDLSEQLPEDMIAVGIRQTLRPPQEIT